MNTPSVTETSTSPSIAPDALFIGKTQAQVSATTGSIIRAWENTPNTVIVPATDQDGKRFEFVFEDARQALFALHCQDRVAEGDAAIQAVGFWNKRTWKKTKTTGGWGHTWQFVVASWTMDDRSYGAVPEGMKPSHGADAREAA